MYSQYLWIYPKTGEDLENPAQHTPLNTRRVFPSSKPIDHNNGPRCVRVRVTRSRNADRPLARLVSSPPVLVLANRRRLRIIHLAFHPEPLHVSRTRAESAEVADIDLLAAV